jgi:hypothetical protein
VGFLGIKIIIVIIIFFDKNQNIIFIWQQNTQKEDNAQIY